MALSSRDMVRIFRALSDPTRVEIVQLVSKSPRNVTELTSLVGVSQPKVSRHLKILRDAGLLNDVRKGKWVWYEMVRHSGREPGSTIAVAMSMFFHAGAASGGRGARPAGARLGGGVPAGTVPAGGVPVSAMPEGTVSRRTASRPAHGAAATSASVESGSAGSEGAASTGARRRETAHKAKPARGTRPGQQKRADRQTERSADKRADKPTRKETPPSRPATSGTPTKDLEDFLL